MKKQEKIELNLVQIHDIPPGWLYHQGRAEACQEEADHEAGRRGHQAVRRRQGWQAQLRGVREVEEVVEGPEGETEENGSFHTQFYMYYYCNSFLLDIFSNSLS